VTIYELVNGVWLQVRRPANAARANFLIVCDYGDWSGFRTLGECLAQIPSSWPSRTPGFFRIEER
jgi:hypothetical protein